MQEEKRKKRSILNIIAAIVIGGLLLLAAVRIFGPSNTVISGSIHYNGLKPEDVTKGKVIVEERELGDKDYQMAVDNVPLKDGANWVWDKAKEGTTYQIRAYILYQNKRIATSDSVTTTAPSVDQELTFNVTSDQLPESDSSTQPTDTAISGVLRLNGYIPDGSTVTVYGKEKDSTADFQELGSGPAEDGKHVSWNAPKIGVYYTFQGELYDANGTFIGQSDYLNIAAPASNQVMTINSTAQAPSQQTSISGVVKINGPVQSGSTLLMLERKPGEKNFSTFDRLPAASDTKWSFDNAQAGQQYEITATLQVNDHDTSVGSSVQVAAPASNQQITINTNYSLTPPTGTPTASCVGQQSGSEWNIKLTFPAIKGAAQYYLQSGTTQGGSDKLGERTAATGGDIIRNIVAADQQQVYTRYAYTFDSACTSKACFSSFSPTLTSKCPQ